MNYTLRRAERGDALNIRRLIWRLRLNPASLDWRRFWVAVDENGGLIGCGQLKPHRGGIVEMASIAVEPAFQRQGVGRAIIERLLAQHQREHPAQPLYLTCRPRMEGYYQRYQFTALADEQMPLYYRRIRRLACCLKRIFPAMDLPTVMRREGDNAI